MSDLAERIKELCAKVAQSKYHFQTEAASELGFVTWDHESEILAGLAAPEERDKPSAIEELQSWLYESKGHSVRITHGDGYGSSPGWDVELFFGVHNVRVIENASNGQYRDTAPQDVTTEQEWPGLDWTIRKAIELARAALQPPKDANP